VSAVAAQIAAARAVRQAAAPVVSNVLPENAMRRTRFIPPVYPERALERGVQGWVDIEFTVLKDGTTGDAKVVAAEPAGMFDRAALAAVNRWRYEPRMVGGTVIDQRVQARVRFEMKD
jgi:protein TonB